MAKSLIQQLFGVELPPEKQPWMWQAPCIDFAICKECNTVLDIEYITDDAGNTLNRIYVLPCPICSGGAGDE